MSVPKIDWSCPQARKRWEEKNIDTLREWAALSFTERIRIVEEMENVVRSIHGGKLPLSLDERGESTTQSESGNTETPRS